MRSKEEANDYRYFPDPDLLPVEIKDETIRELRAALPELPDARKRRCMDEFGLTAYDASVLTASREMADYFEACAQEEVNPKLVSNWIQSELLALLNQKKVNIESCSISAKNFAGLIKLVSGNVISGKIGKDVLPEMFETGKSADAIVKEKGLTQVTDEKKIEAIVDQVVASNAKVVDEFRAGKSKALAFLVGQIMKETKGKANPKVVNEVLMKKLT